jgi:hypothetical protein
MLGLLIEDAEEWIASSLELPIHKRHDLEHI